MKEVLHSIGQLLHCAQTEDRPFPATLLFEEGWMLRLTLQWFAESRASGHDLSFLPNSRWFSEARLASTFLPRYRGDDKAEGYTHADGVIGHFQIARQAELTLTPDAKQFVVTEAKLFSGLSKGTKHAPTYNQAARNVACMAEVIRRANLDPSRMSSLAFFVLAPAEQLGAGLFAECLDRASLQRVVQERIDNCGVPKAEWFERWFLPTLNAMHVCSLPWENVITFIKAADDTFGVSLEAFYRQCLEFNRSPKIPDTDERGHPVPYYVEDGKKKDEKFWQEILGDE